MRLRQLKKLCAEWQQRLRLQDWDIDVVFDSCANLEGKYATCVPTVAFRVALIRIIKPEEIGDDWAGSHDTEVTLVHELLHLHGTGFDRRIERDSTEYTALELMMETVAKALVAAKRGQMRV